MRIVDTSSNMLGEIASDGFAIGLGHFPTGDVTVHTNYHPDWQQLYFNKGWIQSDPVVITGLRSTGICDWVDPSKTQSVVMQAAADHGMRRGVTVATEIGGNRCIVGLAHFKILSDAARAAAQATVRDIHLKHLTGLAQSLSEGQKELVALFAAGLRAKQVADYFSISEEAIKQRKATIQRYLGVNNFLVVVNLCAMAGLTVPRIR